MAERRIHKHCYDSIYRVHLGLDLLICAPICAPYRGLTINEMSVSLSSLIGRRISTSQRGAELFLMP